MASAALRGTLKKYEETLKEHEETLKEMKEMQDKTQKALDKVLEEQAHRKSIQQQYSVLSKIQDGMSCFSRNFARIILMQFYYV